MQSLRDLLVRLANEDYRPPVVPGEEDTALAAEMVHVDSVAAFDDLSSGLNPKVGHLLNHFAFRMAVLALRSRDREPIERGLVAAQLAMKISDPRDVLPSYALLYRSAEELGVDASSLFQSFSFVKGNEWRESPAEFAARLPEHRSISAMGMELIDSDDGLVYKSKPW
jgi:hypothetical protein